MRIAVGGFLHESHSFAPRPTTYADFLQPGGLPPFTAGDGLVAAMRPRSIPLAGAIAVAEEAGVDLVPLAWGFANPAGPVEDEAFERIAACICAPLSAALDQGPLDGVYLDLHGAAVVESFPDAESELLRRVRAIVGADLPLTISLDPHANLTEAMVRLADVAVPFRTYPHVDMKAAGAQAMRLLLARIARGAPWFRAFRALDFWIPLGSQCTLMPPMQPVMTERADLASRLDAVELAFCFGFPYADFAGCGAAIAAYADTQAKADAAADALLAFVNAREASFVQDTLPSSQAVAEARRIAAAASKPVVLADTQDNPGGGGHGDTTELLSELVGQKAKGAVVCLINDAESVAACVKAGVGQTVSLSLGGKSDGMPFACTARVERLTDGTFTLTGPMGAGNPGNLGPTALIDVDGVRVVVTSRKMQALDQAILRHVGIEPADCPIIALKSSVHFRADFGPIAERVIVAIAPGPVVADPAILNFRHVRADLRRRPRTG
ncbi:MAG TPA: M81 family metallopeptidase [Rhodopila sp.]|uniref:M81 family metallopeptidase n=1 Tax=Rhodopila sp. TaxID=2480087 RepID=UPI002B6F733A|nr:M81 family metallopeptidase [Rhodopila sp.]HVY16426.1 M81 family metallopeptidase [Rhodopila sp.]